MKTTKSLKIGITDYDEMKARTLAIARGEHQPALGEPTVWFTSLESVANALSQRHPSLQALDPAKLAAARTVEAIIDVECVEQEVQQ